MNQAQTPDNEVARLKELLAQCAESLEEKKRMKLITRGERDRLNRIKEALAAAPEEPTHEGITMEQWYGGFAKIESTEPDPEWRELGPDEVIQEGDECWFQGPFEKAKRGHVGTNQSIYKALKFRTRRPVPKRGMPLEKEIKRIEWHQNYPDATVHHALADAIRYLRDEIQKLKEAKP